MTSGQPCALPPCWRSGVTGAEAGRVDAAGRAGSGWARFMGGSPLVPAVADHAVGARAGSGLTAAGLGGWCRPAGPLSLPPCVLFCPFYVLHLYLFLSFLFYVIHVCFYDFVYYCVIVFCE